MAAVTSSTASLCPAAGLPSSSSSFRRKSSSNHGRRHQAATACHCRPARYTTLLEGGVARREALFGILLSALAAPALAPAGAPAAAAEGTELQEGFTTYEDEANKFSIAVPQGDSSSSSDFVQGTDMHAKNQAVTEEQEKKKQRQQAESGGKTVGLILRLSSSCRMADWRGRVQRHQVRHGVLPRAGRRLQRQRRHHRDRAGLHQPQVLRRRRRLRRGLGERPGQELAEAAGARREAHRFQGGKRPVLRGVHAAEPRRAAAAHPLGHRDGVQRMVQPPLHGDRPVHRRRGVGEVQAPDREGGSIVQVDMSGLGFALCSIQRCTVCREEIKRWWMD